MDPMIEDLASARIADRLRALCVTYDRVRAPA